MTRELKFTSTLFVVGLKGAPFAHNIMHKITVRSLWSFMLSFFFHRPIFVGCLLIVEDTCFQEVDLQAVVYLCLCLQKEILFWVYTEALALGLSRI